MFSEIDERRLLWGIGQNELCQRAGVHPTSYTARKNGRAEMRESTLAKLRGALDNMIDERRAAIEKAEARS